MSDVEPVEGDFYLWRIGEDIILVTRAGCSSFGCNTRGIRN